MPTIEYDAELMERAMRASRRESEQATVEEALRLLIRLRIQGDAIHALEGAAVWDGDLERSRLGRFDQGA